MIRAIMQSKEDWRLQCLLHTRDLPWPENEDYEGFEDQHARAFDRIPADASCTGNVLAGDASRTWYGSTREVHVGRGFRDIAPGVVSMSTLNVAPQTAPDAADVDTVEGVVRDGHSAPLPAFFGLHASDVWDGEMTAIFNNLVR